MGLALHSTRFLVEAYRSGVRFDKTLTLGQQYMLLSPRRLESILRDYRCWPPPGGELTFRQALAESRWRFGVFARALGAQSVTACDASAYEGASLIHDLNLPIPAEWEQQYDVVIDGGTLEHVFHFPVAISNCMRLLKPGGHLVLLTPANNYFGHGFYQFSPELFYRVLAEENGFRVERMLAIEDGLGQSSLFGVKYDFAITGRPYAVRDSAVIRRRVTLVNRNPTALYVLARKTAHVMPFRTLPQQSFFVEQWQTGDVSGRSQRGWGHRLLQWVHARFSEHFIRENLPRLALLLDPLRRWRWRRRNSFRNRDFYESVRPQTTGSPLEPAAEKESS